MGSLFFGEGMVLLLFIKSNQVDLKMPYFQQLVIDFRNIKTITKAKTNKAAFHSKFIGISRVDNFENVRRIRPFSLIDPDDYFNQRLTDCGFTLRKPE